jgi:hypothetical protein
MAQLRVREHADARRVSQAALHSAVNRRLPENDPVAMGTIRRYWYSTRNGKESGEPIKLVDLDLLGVVAQVLGVRLCDLIEESEPGNWMPTSHRHRYAMV